jgi:endonuclease/exonuclease/phosphatase family metal-dependent hydrolase
VIVHVDMFPSGALVSISMSDQPSRPTLTLATFNIHLGVDGWGRAFDVVGQCRSLDADVLVIQESWAPDDGRPSSAAVVAERLGYSVLREVPLAHGQLFEPPEKRSDRWGPRIGSWSKTFLLDGKHWPAFSGTAGTPSASGWWSLAMLARIPVRRCELLPLEKLRRDAAQRVLIGCTVELSDGQLELFGTHMSHITHGSHAQYRRLGDLLPPPSTPAVLTGDMNLWGPPVSSYLRGWNRAVIGRTWPAYRPHSQVDHVLVTPPVSVLDARIASSSGSDHLPVVVTLGLGTSQ